MFKLTVKGDYKKSETFLQKIKRPDYRRALEKYGEAGVVALSVSTPIDTGLTSTMWSYEVKKISGGYEVVWTNSHIINGVNIAVILQYGHGTRNGGYVRGRDYINPAMRPIFDQLAQEAWEEVTKS